MKKIKILLIDDTEAHVKLIEKYLVEEDAIIISPSFSNNLSEIKKEIKKEKPTDMFVDYFYPDNRTLEDILEDIETDLISDTRIWIISGYDISVREMIELRQEWPNIQNQWIAKPFDKDEILSLLAQIQLKQIERKNLWNDLKKIKNLDSIPLPIRFYQTKTKKTNVNKAWPMASNRPDIPDLKDIQADIPHEDTYWHHTAEPESKGGGMYNIQSFIIPELPERIWQTATKTDVPEHSLEDMVKLVFATMKDAGFPRGRFYRIIDVPDSNVQKDTPSGQVEIVLRTGDGYPDKKIPSRHPISGFWQRRIKNAEDNVCEEKFNYHILSRADDSIKQTKDFQFWDEFNAIFDSVENSLEVPIFQKIHAKYKCVGSFCFDRLHKKTKKTDTIIQKKDITLIENTLKKIIFDVRKRITDNKKLQRQELYEKLNEIDDRIKQQKNLNTALKIILEESLKITYAESGIIAFRPGNANHLKVIEQNLLPEQYVLEGVALSLTSDLLTVESWRLQKPIFHPNFKETKPEYRTIDDIFKNDGEKKNNFKKAIKKIGSCVALPILLDNKIIGSITLHHSVPYFFNSQKVHAIKILLKRVKWFLKIKMIENDQENREGCLVHEIRSHIRELKTTFNSLDFNKDKYKRNVKFNIQSLLDLTDRYSILKSGFRDEKSNTIDLPPLLYDTTQLYDYRMSFKELKIKKQNWDQKNTLKGDAVSIALVLRTILSNAIKFSPRKGKISISVEKQKMLRITISNTGSISKESKQLAFTPDVYLMDDKKDGLHIGLASAKRIVESYGGEISIDNDQKNENVIVSFTWPIAEEG
ncbi:putative Histidine kinase [Candidatus Desulfarcum epimagneticum]|uniref:histidine kinase n=1 Tax=uncultured Desulfobacteraceae bacterium TaxID=218296 RepID=A0A484HLE8_9BACT|nr:putative Histidine kinase [uncultured Desulfobacteraceae bacterium]